MLFAASCSTSSESIPGGGRRTESARNVILLIGDGMGVSHITAAKIVAGSLNMDRFTTAGLVTTYPAGRLVTDSAASATAVATGFKTSNGTISISPQGDTLKTALEYAESAGKSTGLVVTCAVTHATPAAFASHVGNRNDYQDIALQMARSEVDVMFGGGWGYFVPSSQEGSLRQDELDPMAQLESRMPVVYSASDLLSLNGPAGCAFIAANHPGDADERGITLSQMVQKALDMLSDDADGFFLMVEGSQIDWAAHDGDKDGIIREVLDFDGAVGTALDYASADGNTLVIVTADHETGGFAVHDGSVEDRQVTEAGFTTGSHTASMVPLFAYGPGCWAFGGIMDNTSVGRMLIEILRS